MKKMLTLGLLLTAQLAIAGGGEYTVQGLTTPENVTAVKAKVCSLKTLDTCEVTAGKIKVTSKSDNKSQDSDLRKALKEAGNYQITDYKEVGNGKGSQK